MSVLIVYGRPNFLRMAAIRGSRRRGANSGSISSRPMRCGSLAPVRSFGRITDTRFPAGDVGSSRQVQLAISLEFLKSGLEKP